MKIPLMILPVILILVVLIGFNVGEMLSKIPSRPVIKSKSNEWSNSNIVEIDKDAILRPLYLAKTMH